MSKNKTTAFRVNRHDDFLRYPDIPHPAGWKINKIDTRETGVPPWLTPAGVRVERDIHGVEVYMLYDEPTVND